MSARCIVRTGVMVLSSLATRGRGLSLTTRDFCNVFVSGLRGPTTLSVASSTPLHLLLGRIRPPMGGICSVSGVSPSCVECDTRRWKPASDGSRGFATHRRMSTVDQVFVLKKEVETVSTAPRNEESIALASPGTGEVKSSVTTLSRKEWTERADAHRDRVRVLTDGSVHHDRNDPIFNFLFEYYHFKPRTLLQWTPGIDVYLQDADPASKGCPLPQKGWEPGPDGGGRYNPFALKVKSRQALQWQRNFLEASSKRAPVFHCFGLHEWAMLYRPPGVETDARSIHQALPLRVPQETINSMVEGRGGSMGCTHFDAFRFFTPEARPLNSVQLSRESATSMDQPGCVHANMDLFKWALRMWPMLPSEEVIDALELAVSCRMLDMRASPYDLTAHGKSAHDGRGGGKLGGLPPEAWNPTPVQIETESGRKEYQQGQLQLYHRSMPIRKKLLERMDRLLEAWKTEEFDWPK